MDILLIEDNELNREMLKRRLEKKLHNVSCAHDGKQGFELAKELKPDMILMDLSLPLVDGWELAGMLKSNSLTKDIPIIALTAHAMKGDREKALEAGCDDYDTKPIDFAGLLEKMGSLIEV
tara:strand:+ start:121 stop:483 length:363 start_codon:yes stop_codon:yes gene_type:complete